jgi:hypothetical protein
MHSREHSSIAVLIPCYNEELTIGDVVRRFREQLPQATIYFRNSGRPHSRENRNENSHVNETNLSSPRPSSRARFLAGILVAALYVSAIAFTNAYFMADSGGYVVSILAYAGVDEYVVENPTTNNFRAENSFWDFGHLLWRPLGLLLFRICHPLSNLVVGLDPALNMMFLLMAVNFIAGLLSAVLLYSLIDSLIGRRWLAVFVVGCFIFSNGFLNFIQTGSSYIAALAFLIAGLYLLLKDRNALSTRNAIAAGLACAAAVALWFPYILGVPATILAPIVLFGPDRRRRSSLIYAGAAFAVAILGAYLIVMAWVGVHNVADFQDWIAVASHGVRQSGLLRMLFGVSRSFIHLGNDGVLFKRFLLHDSLNPVSAGDLVRFSLWKLVLFYLAAAAVLLALVISTVRRMLVLMLMTAVPLIIFAIKFDGGAIERYLPVYPVIFISFAWVVAQSQASRALRAVPVLFFCVAVFVNSSVMACMVLDRQKQHTSERVQAIVPRLKPNSWLVTTHLQDDLVNFQSSFPFEPINRHNTYHIYPLVVLNSDQASRWREEFASNVLKAWEMGGDAWLSCRLLSAKPEPQWNWVEGDDPRVKWNDIYQFLAQFDTSDMAGGADGFVLLEKSEKNTQLLNTIVQKRETRMMALVLSIAIKQRTQLTEDADET